MNELQKLNQLSESHGALRPGTGMVSGVIALSLAVLCFLGVLAFHFPEYLTTPDLRKKYDVNVLREVLLIGMVIAGGLALSNLIRRRNRWLNATALAGIATRKDSLVLTIKSDRPLNNQRIHKSEQTSARRFHHEVKLTTPAEVDNELMGWLTEAYRLSA